MPRLPSIDAISAVSSPQTNAPAPSRMSTWKLKRVPQMLLPSRPSRSACRMAVLQPLDGQRILGAHVDVALLRAHGVGRDRHALQHAVRIAFEHAAIHERAGIAFVRVADHVLLLCRRPWRPCSTSSPVGYPAPPRPRSPLFDTSSMTCAASSR